ncbi:MAG: hypothetical protein GW878_00710 [Acidobacteria bacterium]|nr:hypothetical protein [Acidobacteriota bacterium]
MRNLDLVLLALLVAGAASAGQREVQLALPLRPKLALSGHERLYVGPFLRENPEDKASADVRFDVANEFERYLRRLLRKETKFVLVATLDAVRLPTTDPLQLGNEADFWRGLGQKTGADIIVAGSIDFQIQDTNQPKIEAYESPTDGRTYYRQVMVEQTGFTYDILLNVYDARSGALVLQEPLKDTQQRDERSFDEFTGMFANLYALENQLVGIFVPRTIKTKRILFTR